MSISGRERQIGPRAALALEAITLMAILAAASYLRLAQLSDNPGWYSDEGTLADIAAHLARGKLQYQALTDSTLLVARMPLVPLIVAALMPAGGEALETLRAFSAILGVISTGLLYLAVRWMLGGERAGFALLAAGLFAIYPPAVFYARIGFSYNLLTPLLLIALAGLWMHADRQHKFGALIAGTAIGLGTLTDLMMVSVLIAAVLVLLVQDRKLLRWWLPLTLTPLTVYLAMIAFSDARVLTTDLGFIAARLAVVPWWAQASLIVLNLGTLMLTEVWWIPALIGLLVMQPRRLSRLMLTLLLVPLVLLGRTTGLAGLRLYSISPLFPWVAMGVASLLWHGVPRLLAVTRAELGQLLERIPWVARTELGSWSAARLTTLGSAAVLFLLALSPLLISAFQLVGQVQQGFGRGNAWAYVPVRPAREAVDWVNLRTAPTDLVFASPAIAWALEAQAADFQQLLAYSGSGAIDYPADLPRDRFAYELSLDRATYVIVDSIWRGWGAVHIPEVDRMLDRIDAWPTVWQDGGIEVHENPAR